jgi:putative transposase
MVNSIYYLSVIEDLLNNEIVAWKLSNRNDLELVLNTVEEWTRKKTYLKPFSIRIKGSSIRLRYTTIDLEEYSIKGSHSRKGNCLDNACVESLFSHLKKEKLYIEQCKSGVEIRQAI